MKVLVTGVDGFVGGAFLKYLRGNTDWDLFGVSRRRGCNFIDYDKVSCPFYYYCDLEHNGAVELMMANVLPDIIIHCASKANSKDNNRNDPFHKNILSTYNLIKGIEWAQQPLYNWQVKPTFINLSSVVVYGTYHEVHPPTEASHLLPKSPYALSKMLGEDILYYGLNQEIIGNLINLRCCAIVGQETTHGLVHDIKAKLKGDGDTLELYGSMPGSIKPFIHIDDVIGATMHLLNRENNEMGGTINICPDDNISVLDVANLIMVATNTKKEIIFNENVSFKGDNPYIKCSNNLLNKLGYKMRHESSAEAILNAI